MKSALYLNNYFKNYTPRDFYIFNVIFYILQKTIITSISLLLISFYQIKAQQTYMPVFGNDTTTFYYNICVGNIVSAFYKQNWIKKNKSNMYFQSEKDNHHLQGYEVGVGDSIEVSSDNSKIWVHEFFNKIKN